MPRLFLTAALIFGLAGSALAQCPAQGAIDVNRATANQLGSAGLSRAQVSAVLNGRPFQGYRDLEEVADDNDFTVPSALVVCPGSGRSGGGAEINSALDSDADAININSANAADLAGLSACGINPALRAQQNQRASFKTARAFLGSIRAPNRDCRSLRFKLSSRGEVFTF